MSTDNPFSQVYDALWGLLESHEGFTGLVRVGNRIRYDAARDPDKDVHTTTDLPEVRLVPTGGTPLVQTTTSSTQIKLTYEIQVSSGDLRLDAALYPVAWEILCAVTKWHDELRKLTWRGNRFVVHGRAVSLETGISDSDVARGISGWADKWGYEVLCAFGTADMQSTK